jgi:hypothetical protein
MTAVLPPPVASTTPRALPPDRAAATAAVTVAVVFTGAFTLLGITFDYPAVLDDGAAEVLARFAAAGTATRVLWYAMLVASLSFVPLAVLLGRSLAARLSRPTVLVDLAVAVGVTAGVVQAVGFARWTFAVPYLAATFTDPAATPATRESVVVAYEVLHRLVGGGLGEHLGYAATAGWTVLTALLLARVPGVPRLVPAVGVAAAVAIATGLVEVTGATWPALPVAGGYLVFAAWLVGLGWLLRPGRPDRG